MDVSGLLILANDVEFIPVNSMTENIKSGFEHTNDDIVITHLNTRTTSKVISKDLAALLQEFRSPKSMAEVIYAFSESHQRDPQDMADEVFGSLVNMRQWGFILPYDQTHSASNQGILPLKKQFRNYIIIERYRLLEDTEVYRVKDDAERMLALKLLRQGINSPAQMLFSNEIRMLQVLDGKINPSLEAHGSEDDFLFLVTEWCNGLTCGLEALKYRNINVRSNLVQLLNLSVYILKAYHHLHRQGVLHGDVNPENIIISPEGSVKIIDFGYSVFAGSSENVERGGTGFYYEPEFAAAVIQDKTHPPVTEKGEQYSIAAVIFYLISGHSYMQFSFEKEKMYTQILKDEPLTLRSFDLPAPDGLDHVLAKALSKDPENRYASLEDFALALTEIRDQVYETNRFYVFNKQNAEEDFIAFLTRKFGWNSPFIERGLVMPPTSSVNYGAAGIAYMFYRMSCVREDVELSDLADVWANRALLFNKNYDRSFYSSADNINQKIVGKTSLYHSPTGIYLTQALISNSRNDWHTLYSATEGFLSEAKKPCDKLDLTLGKAGLLIGCSILYKELMTINEHPVAGIISLAEEIKNEIWNRLNEYPAMNRNNPVEYFGIAHGWAGLLYATLLWCNTSSSELPNHFMKRLDELLNCSIIQEDTIRWPLSVVDTNSWTGWCNGSSGHIFLWMLLFKQFKDEKYIRIAEKLAAHLMTGIQHDHTNLCCGMTGTAYALMQLHAVTGEKKYAEETERIKQHILLNWTMQPGRNNSLYKGEPGIGVFLCELNKPSLLRMPLFE
jgi:serine/threonine-protein kinase